MKNFAIIVAAAALLSGALGAALLLRENTPAPARATPAQPAWSEVA